MPATDRIRVFLTLGVTFLAGSSASASAPFYEPLAAMVADAEAVAVVRIEKMEPIPRPKDLPSVWYPDRTVTVRPTDVVRGKLPETFTIRVDLDRNSSAKEGTTALVFLSSTKAGPDGDLPAYEAAQGFRVVADLVEKGDEKAQAAARDALVAAVKADKRHSQHGRMWDPELSEAAMAPLLKLLDSQDPVVRRWALTRGLHYVHVSANLGKRLVAQLDDKDPEVAASAALTLAHKQYRSAAKELDAYRKRIPAGKAFEYYANEVYGTLQLWKVMERFDALPEALTKRVGAELAKRAKDAQYAALELWLDKDSVQLEERFIKDLPDALLRDLSTHFSGLRAKLDKLPLRVTLYVQLKKDVVIWDGNWHR